MNKQKYQNTYLFYVHTTCLTQQTMYDIVYLLLNRRQNIRVQDSFKFKGVQDVQDVKDYHILYQLIFNGQSLYLYAFKRFRMLKCYRNNLFKRTHKIVHIYIYRLLKPLNI